MTEIEHSGVVAAIIPAGGMGHRFGNALSKQFVDLAHWPILAHTLSRFDQTALVDQVILVVPRGQKTRVKSEIIKRYDLQKIVNVVIGGETRQESVYLGFLALDEDVEYVLVHDAVRPLVRLKTVEDVILVAQEFGAAIAAMPVRDTLKQVDGDNILKTMDRTHLWQAQTPQVFERSILAEALSAARRDGFIGTDEASLVERLGKAVKVVHGAADNIKITHPEDLILAECLISSLDGGSNMRIGTGYDVHALVKGRKLVLGGVEIPFNKGLDGHSDADVVIHALCDALLSAAGLPDIGVQFPDTDPEWAGAPGLKLLELVIGKVREKGFELASADITLLAEKPKIRDYVPDMIQAMSGVLGMDKGGLNIKGTTTEGLGSIGRGEGMAAWAVTLIRGALTH